MRVVTSFGPDGYEIYGKRFLESFTRMSEADVFCYHEGKVPDFRHPRVEYRNVMDVPGCREFLANAPQAARGFSPFWRGRNYRFDVYRFCRKSFAQIDAASEYDGKLYWIDADVEVLEEPEFPTFGAEFMQYLGRPEWHSCASFVGWNCAHDESTAFWEAYHNLYTSGTVYVLPEWHDSYVLDWIRESAHLGARNLAAGLELKGPANVFDEVFSWGTHYKGNKKKIPVAH